MQPYLNELADELERFSPTGVIVDESDSTIIINNAVAKIGHDLAGHLSSLGWSSHAEEANGDVAAHLSELNDDFGPFRIIVSKPKIFEYPYFLTVEGFSSWCRKASPSGHVYLVGMDTAFETLSFRATFPQDPSEFFVRRANVSPRRLVREVGDARIVPNEMGQWLLREPIGTMCEDRFFRAWAKISVREILFSLADEVHADGSLMIGGARSPTFFIPELLINEINLIYFNELQKAGLWVYESDGEAETRHVLLLNELGRSDFHGNDPIQVVKVIGRALDGARIAHLLGLKKLSAESLKAMSDLRKSIVDETVKLSDSTRQLATAAAGAVLAGVGATAARIMSSTPQLAFPLVLVGVVLVLYMASMIIGGYHFLIIQRGIRLAWKDRLYRFLPAHEYKAMVEVPAAKSETGFKIAASLSSISTVVLFLAIYFSAYPDQLNALLIWLKSL